jgi:hypothetical protein
MAVTIRHSDAAPSSDSRRTKPHKPLPAHQLMTWRNGSRACAPIAGHMASIQQREQPPVPAANGNTSRHARMHTKKSGGHVASSDLIMVQAALRTCALTQPLCCEAPPAATHALLVCMQLCADSRAALRHDASKLSMQMLACSLKLPKLLSKASQLSTKEANCLLLCCFRTQHPLVLFFHWWCLSTQLNSIQLNCALQLYVLPLH